MKLSLISEHLSINTFPDITLPNFTLVTGVNGSGKTHLLQAIDIGHISNSITNDYHNDSKLFDWSTLIPNNVTNVTTENVHQNINQLLGQIEKTKSQRSRNLHHLLNNLRLDRLYNELSWRVIHLSAKELLAHLPESQKIPEKSVAAHQAIQNFAKNVADQIADSQVDSGSLRRLSPPELLFATQEFLEVQPLGWYVQDLFKQSFSQVFLSYFEQRKVNMLRKQDAKEGRDSGAWLSEEAFLDRHGEPPWEFVNRIIEDAGLGFKISHPVGYLTTSFTPKLTKIGTGAEIQFSQLSSGEKILMSFAFCLYHSNDNRHELQKPKILLFDEIDSPLHPSMSRQLINTITGALVEEHGIHVIMTTHSPSTVAVAPEDSVYIMKPDSGDLVKASKRQAISVLTSEIPTLAINFDGRRQVFVESGKDAERYDFLYEQLSPILDSERSLVFMGVGRTKANGDDGSGCDKVKSIVRSLEEGGNESVYGLIDWDTKNVSNGRLHVLAEGRRYAIENCLLDPLLVGALLLREGENAKNIGLDEKVGYMDFSRLNEAYLQKMVDVIQRAVLEVAEDIELNDIATVKYRSGLELKLSTVYLHMKGHGYELGLEERIKRAFPCLIKFHNSGELLMKMVNPILVDLPEFVPVELIESFQKLLADEK